MMIQGPCTRTMAWLFWIIARLHASRGDAGYFEHNEDPHASTRNGKAVGVPGTVAGLLEAAGAVWNSVAHEQMLAPAISVRSRGVCDRSALRDERERT